jgi:calcium-dependent protein kinase
MLEYEEIFEGYKQYFNGDERRAEYEARRIIEVLDLNQNGAIEYSEFLIANIDPKKLIREDRLREVFDMFDVDHSGAITVDEIKQILGGGAMAKAEKQLVNPQHLTIKTQEMPRGGIEP